MDRLSERTRLLILGMGRSGQSVARYSVAMGLKPKVYDAKAATLASHADVRELLDRGVFLSDDMETALAGHYDLAVASPGFSARHPLCENLRLRGIPLVGEVAFACSFLDVPIIAITGTNGKTTTTLLTAHILRECGHDVRCVGNVGTPITEVLCELGRGARPMDCLVVELSSYQLEDLRSRSLHAAVILNIASDHLDRYASLRDYALTKLQIGCCLKPSAPLFVSRSVAASWSQEIEDLGLHPHIFDDQAIVQGLEYGGAAAPHERQNYLAARALCRHMGLPDARIAAAAATFMKPSHRLQYVGSIGGVAFYDDSKATNVSAVESAVEALQGDIFLIAGGVAKGQSFVSWRDSLLPKVKALFVIGKDGTLIEQAMGDLVATERCATLDEAVDSAYRRAAGRGVVLLSPGCASTDMFEDYAQRGMLFQKKVRRLGAMP